MRDVVSYDIDNVRIRYSGENDAKAYAAGAEFRFFGELVKDAESWVSIGLMRTKENLNNDRYYNYKLNDRNIGRGWLATPAYRSSDHFWPVLPGLPEYQQKF